LASISALNNHKKIAMKQFNKYIVVVLLFAVLGSCKKGSFLDPKSVTDLNEATVFSDSARTIAVLTGIYSSVSVSFNHGKTASYMDVSDETDGRYTGGTNLHVRFAQGTLNPSDGIIGTDAFNMSTAYRSIRRANLYMNKVDEAPLSAELKKRTKAEARFLRAWYYAMLTKAYGGVQLMGDKVLEMGDPIVTPRSTYKECVEYIVSECEKAADDLPASYTGLDYGRATKGACLALKARVLLYAASPLFNGGSIATDTKLKELTSYPTADPQLWNKAAQAFLDVINLNQYQLETDNSKPGLGFYRVFLKRVNNEYIFAGMTAANRTLEAAFYPQNISGAAPVHFPLQNAVDKFGTVDGLSITDPASGYTDNNPYINRDPRFYYSIVFNGSKLFTTTGNTQAQIFTYVNNAAPNNNPQTANYTIVDNTVSNDNTKTGYYPRKMCDTSTAGNGGANTERCLPLIRYAEMILGYAEALNEMGQTEAAVDQIKIIRTRAGIKPGANNRYGIAVGINQSDMRTLIRNERSVELMFEEHRFWDVRRWKIAPQTETAEMQGMKITKNGSSYTYERYKAVRQHYWPANHSYYLMPYNLGELAKLPGILIQNPGW
jgi:hypothetical protein